MQSREHRAKEKHEKAKKRNAKEKIGTYTGCAGIHTVQEDAQEFFDSEALIFFLSSHEKIFGAVVLMA